MIKILDSKKKNFSSSLDNLLLKRKKKIKFNSNVVVNIIKEKKMEIKHLLNMKKNLEKIQ